MIRLVAESGGIIQGGLAQVGRVGVTWAMRSCTSCRALTSSVPRSKMSSIAESWETDFERSSSRPGSPVSCSSIGIVISSSTSFEELPRAIVWISTRGGANSGKTSTFAVGICATPKAISAVAANSTSHRKRRLLETIQRISERPARADHWLAISSSAPWTSAAPTVTTVVPAGGPSESSTRSPSMRRTSTSCPQEGQRPRARVDVGIPLGVVDQRGVWDGLAPIAARRPSRSSGRSAWRPPR